jgi:hypothetical protein
MRKKNENKKGVGKPTLYKKAMKRVNVMLDEDTIKFYTEQGKGNLSEGIRKHWRGLTSLALDGATRAEI